MDVSSLSNTASLSTMLTDNSYLLFIVNSTTNIVCLHSAFPLHCCVQHSCVYCVPTQSPALIGTAAGQSQKI
ncbi:hypothetical protein KC19_7G131800 [Ceratodon purpureus]|uniref:Uncharacterized protein n=1 Tax=Ceratodon purpureus TaxID=3225 RepID=A0A8T0HAL2_CERPU|nr:hypothetical protein KC19_7G131800 [Ceratodon purpureus]